jgi:hypothetical protein
LGIPIHKRRLYIALAWSGAFLAVVAATVAARGISATSGEGATRTLDDVVRAQGLRFGSELDVLQATSPRIVAPPAPPPSNPEAKYAFIWPHDSYLVQGMWAGHPLGIDIGSAPGDPVLAVRDGNVTFAGGDPCCSYGLFVIIEHDEGWSSLYGHLSEIDVEVGDQVKQGDAFALSGGTGHVTGPHVHFELRHHGGIVDPLVYLEPHRDWAPTDADYAELRRPDTSPQIAEAPPAAVVAEEPPPVAAPDGRTNGLNSVTALGAAVQWLTSQEQSAYYIDAADCTTVPSGPNYWVTCNARLQGCRGEACIRQLTACVFDQPRLVTAACPIG